VGRLRIAGAVNTGGELMACAKAGETDMLDVALIKRKTREKETEFMLSDD
jgi:hypothetical protein